MTSELTFSARSCVIYYYRSRMTTDTMKVLICTQ